MKCPCASTCRGAALDWDQTLMMLLLYHLLFQQKIDLTVAGPLGHCPAGQAL